MRRHLLILIVLSGLCHGAAQASVFLSPDAPTTLNGVTYQPWEVILRDDTGAYSAALTLPANTSIDGLYRMNSGEWLLSVESPTTLGGTTFDPRDVIRFDGVGAYTLFFAGAAAGIPAGVNVDALLLDGGDAGDLVISLDTPALLGAVTYEPADLIRYAAGSYSMFFDASATTPPIPGSTNLTGAGRRGRRTFLTFDVPTTLGATTYRRGQIVTWDGAAFAAFAFDATWPTGSHVQALALGACLDGDGDGYGAPGDAACLSGQATDCDDASGPVHPGAPQICDGLNNDCLHPSWPGLANTNEASDDGDAFTECAGDCDDSIATVYPGAPQICDALNNDCLHPSWPGLAGTTETDDDGDGPSECTGDCDDSIATVYPGAPQICDFLNNDCLDPSWPVPPAIDTDNDADGLAECGGDCDDAAPVVYPGAPQICDGQNNDCTYPGWPALAGTNEADDDGDGFTECAGDCSDADGLVWATPGEVLDVMFPDPVTLSWSVPEAPGAVPAALLYDTIRSTNPADFVTTPPAACLESDDGPDTFATDTGIPPVGSVFFYLVRAQNACPAPLGVGPLGTTSSGVPRTARDCP
jgi:putative metal-binding protein